MPGESKDEFLTIMSDIDGIARGEDGENAGTTEINGMYGAVPDLESSVERH